MNNDLISRETAIAEITSWIFTDEDLEGEYDEYQYFNQGIKRAIKALAKVPAVDAEPVRHAAWTYKDDDVCYWWECNACGSGETMNTAYCPNCGAKMDLEEINDQK